MIYDITIFSFDAYNKSNMVKKAFADVSLVDQTTQLKKYNFLKIY